MYRSDQQFVHLPEPNEANLQIDLIIVLLVTRQPNRDMVSKDCQRHSRCIHTTKKLPHIIS